MKSISITYITIIIFSTLAAGCGKSGKNTKSDLNDTDTLRVVTLYGPTSYFLYRGEEMGIEYENIKRFADENNLPVKVKAVNNINELITELKEGESQIAAYPVPHITEYNSDIIYCGQKATNWQVLVQKNSDSIIKDVTELIGKPVYVEKDSKYHYRLENLNEDLGGGINIIPISDDTISSEDFLALVDKGKMEYAVVDSDIAELHKADYPKLDTSLKLSLEQTSSWAVAPHLDTLAMEIDRWGKNYNNSSFVKEIFKRYYERGKNELYDIDLTYIKEKFTKNETALSKYKPLFKKYSEESVFDWEFLAAIAFCESGFEPDAVSRFGATGLMQVMPSSAAAVGVEPESLTNPESNIKAAAKIIERIDRSLRDKVDDPEERLKFVLASYNSGLGHIYDSMSIAEKNGLDPKKWWGNTGVAILMKSRPEYFNDPIVKHGYFRGRETADFVDKVMSIYQILKENNQ